MEGFLKKDQKILIAGANGMVGSAIKRELIKKGYGKGIDSKDLFTPSKDELNYFNYLSVKNWFKTYKPTVVILAAAKVGGINANKKYPADFLLNNLKIQTNIIENAGSIKFKNYFSLDQVVFIQNYQNNLSKKNPSKSDLEPTNEWYAIAKICGLKPVNL